MDATDLTVEILKGIRDEMREMRMAQTTTNAHLTALKVGQDATNERLDETNRRLDQTNRRLGGTNDRLDHLAEGQVRLATSMADTNERLGDLVRSVDQLSGRIDNVLIGPVGTAVRDLQVRLARVEEHTGIAG